MPQGFHKYVVFLSTCTVIAWYLNIFQSKYPKKLFTRGMIFWFLNHWDARKLVPFWILPSQLANFRASKMESKSFFPFIIITLMSLVAHRFGHVEFQIFVIVFLKQANLKKSTQIHLRCSKFDTSKSMSYQGH